MDGYTITNNGLWVRPNPWVTQEDGIATLKPNDVVEKLATTPDGTWFKVQHGAVTGWASRRYLAPVAQIRTDDP